MTWIAKHGRLRSHLHSAALLQPFSCHKLCGNLIRGSVIKRDGPRGMKGTFCGQPMYGRFLMVNPVTKTDAFKKCTCRRHQMVLCTLVPLSNLSAGVFMSWWFSRFHLDLRSLAYFRRGILLICPLVRVNSISSSAHPSLTRKFESGI